MINLKSVTPLSIKVNDDNTLHYRGLTKCLDDGEILYAILDIPKMTMDMESIEIIYDDFGKKAHVNTEIEILVAEKRKELFTLNVIDTDEYKKVLELMEK